MGVKKVYCTYAPKANVWTYHSFTEENTIALNNIIITFELNTKRIKN